MPLQRRTKKQVSAFIIFPLSSIDNTILFYTKGLMTTEKSCSVSPSALSSPMIQHKKF